MQRRLFKPIASALAWCTLAFSQTYNAPTERTILAKPPLPQLGPANSIVTDPTFGTRILRVTDASTIPANAGEWFTTSSASYRREWSPDSTRFLVQSSKQKLLLYELDPTTFQVRLIQTVPVSGEQYSSVDRDVIYGMRNRLIVAYNVAAKQTTTVLDLDAVVPGFPQYTYAPVFSTDDSKVLQAFSGYQDTFRYVVWYDRTNAAKHLLDLRSSTLDGVPLPFTFPEGTGIHSIDIDRTGRYATLVGPGITLGQKGQWTIWDTQTGTFTPVTTMSSGHTVMGYGAQINLSGILLASGGSDGRGFTLRQLDNVNSNLLQLTKPEPPKPANWCVAGHASWGNVKPDNLEPLLVSYLDPTNCTPWTWGSGEIQAVATDGSGVAWRLAHHRSLYDGNFYDSPRGNVSPDGRYLIFTSNWEKTLGYDPGGAYRRDVFLLELPLASTSDSSDPNMPPPPSLPITVAVTPPSAVLHSLQAQQFMATVTNSANAGVSWSISPNVGSITQSGLYTAPVAIANQQTVVVTATSLADATKSAAASITLMPVMLSVAPSVSTLHAGASQQFTATVTDAVDKSVAWSISPNVGSINPSGLYTAPANVVAQQAITITATSQADRTKSAIATITLVPQVIITVNPAMVSLSAAETRQFTAAVTNSTNPAVAWSLSSPGVGSISPSGLYTAPTSISAPQTITVIATSMADGSQSASATVILNPAMTIAISPASAVLSWPSDVAQFTATVRNTTKTAVTWSLNPNLGSITGSGLYTAPAGITTQQVVSVTARSQADGTRSATASVLLMPQVTLAASPAKATLSASQTQQFTAVSNAFKPTITWSLSPNVGSITASGLYTAPASVASQRTVAVTATLKMNNHTLVASASITLMPVTVAITPGTATLYGSTSLQFGATVTNSANKAVSWSLNPSSSNVGTISTSGLYTAPVTVKGNRTVTVTATSQAERSKTASATINLIAASARSR